MQIVRKSKQANPSVIRLGYVALTDCAPLAMAQELGLFAKHGVEVRLTREVGWATIRDKILYRELDAAQAPAGMLAAMHCGIGTVRTPCVTGLVLNLQGNAITLSERLWECGVRDGATLREHIAASRERLTFGVVYQHSSHAFLLRSWLKSHGISPDRDVQLVVVPPAQVFRNLLTGHLDGYCVGEPWNSLAVMRGAGWVVATSAELDPRHLEKVLLVRADFAEARQAEHLGLIAALIEAAEFCDRPANRERLVEVLAEFIDAPTRAVQMSLSGSFDYGHGRVEKTGPQHVFHADGASEPSAARAQWLIENLQRHGSLLDPSVVTDCAAADCFRTDLFHQALQLIHA